MMKKMCVVVVDDSTGRKPLFDLLGLDFCESLTLLFDCSVVDDGRGTNRTIKGANAATTL
jgi:hypothetical protein